MIQRLSYDPFGKRTVTSGTDPDRKAWTARGFTGHEHLDNLGLIHMNARLYDPEIGRFISADTYIQSPGMSQSYNRYMYVMGNPLKYTDPSGHFWNFIIGAVISLVASQSDNKFIRTIGMVAGMALMGGVYGNSLFVGAGSIGNVAAAGFVQGYATTGSLAGAFREGFFSALSAGVAGFIGHSGAFSTSIGQTLAHGIAQGVISELRGGNFKAGFVGAMIGKASGSAMGSIGGISPLAITLRTVTAAVFGGLAAEATGGSFADGALSAAMTHLFNDEGKNILFAQQAAKKQYLSVTPAGNILIIEAAFAFDGDKNTQGVRDRIFLGIRKIWSGKVGDYAIQLNLREDINSEYMIHIVSDTKSEHGASVSYVNRVGGKEMFFYHADSGWVAAHEFGHVLGLDDHYTGRDPSKADIGWEGKLMGEHGGRLSSKEVGCLLGKEGGC